MKALDLAALAFFFVGALVLATITGWAFRGAWGCVP